MPVDNESEADFHFERGCEALKLDRYARAIKWFTKALDVLPGWHEPLQRRALIRYFQKDYAASIVDYRAALRSIPDCVWCMEGISDAYRKLGNRRAALRITERAVFLAPENGSLHFDLAMDYFTARRFAEAATQIEAAVEHDSHRFKVFSSEYLAAARALSGNRRGLQDLDKYPSVRGLVYWLIGERDASLNDLVRAKSRKALRLIRSKRPKREVDKEIWRMLQADL